MTELYTFSIDLEPSPMILRSTTLSAAYNQGLDLALGIDLPVFLIQVEFRYDINQFHVGFPIGTQSTHLSFQ